MRLRPPEVDKLVARYLAGETVQALAVRFGVHRSTLHDLRVGRGVPTRVPDCALDDEAVTRAGQLHADGFSMVAIARDHGVHPATVARALERAGVRQGTARRTDRSIGS